MMEMFGEFVDKFLRGTYIKIENGQRFGRNEIKDILCKIIKNFWKFLINRRLNFSRIEIQSMSTNIGFT